MSAGLEGCKWDAKGQSPLFKPILAGRPDPWSANAGELERTEANRAESSSVHSDLQTVGTRARSPQSALRWRASGHVEQAG
jgi:hypothetical protein